MSHFWHISAIGPGLISVTALMAAMTVSLAKETGVHPIKLLPFPTLDAFAGGLSSDAFAGGLSSITPSGIVAITKAAEVGITGLDWPLLWKMALSNVLYALILYFFVFKWHKIRGVAMPETEKAPALTLKQWATLAGIVVTALLTVLLDINVGLVGIAVSVVLTVIGAADEGAALKKVPWGALIPTVPGLVENLSRVTALGLTVSLCIGAHLAALSPLSSCGGLMLAAYSSDEGVDAKARNKMFIQLFAMSACGVLFGAGGTL